MREAIKELRRKCVFIWHDPNLINIAEIIGHSIVLVNVSFPILWKRHKLLQVLVLHDLQKLPMLPRIQFFSKTCCKIFNLRGALIIKMPSSPLRSFLCVIQTRCCHGEHLWSLAKEFRMIPHLGWFVISLSVKTLFWNMELGVIQNNTDHPFREHFYVGITGPLACKKEKPLLTDINQV